MQRILLLTLAVFLCIPAIGQELSQTIRGTVLDQDSRMPLIGATVAIYQDSTLVSGSTANLIGAYRIESVPIGRYTLVASFLGYSQIVRPGVIVNSGKETIVPLKMEESVVKMAEVQITASRNKGEAMNEMATVSARTFSVEETERYAGSRGDPARMASNFAGVQGADDSRNDIIVRGNSPLGILYRVEGIDIPNPNHFAIAGSSGGPISILNNKVMGNSDFFTGAFPAEFGNSIAGVFDIQLRNGNNEQFEFTGQFGLFGTEMTAEGPINKEKRSSFLVNYRYATLTLFSSLGINLGTTATPFYQDASFKLNYPQKKGGNLSFFGIGGTSSIDILISEQKPEEVEIYGNSTSDQFFSTRMGVLGMNYVKPLDESTFMKMTIATTGEKQFSKHNLLFRSKDSLGTLLVGDNGLFLIDSSVAKLGYEFNVNKISTAFFINKKYGASHVLKFGYTADYYRINMLDSNYNDGTTYDWTVRWNYTGNALLFQPYISWKYRISEKLVLNAGVHSQVFTLNGSVSPIEPRAGLRWKMKKGQTINLGIGLHSQLQPMYTYFYHGNNHIRHNIGMDFTKSFHGVIGYDKRLGSNMRFKAETYYQRVYNIPVTVQPSSFSLVNQGSGFNRFFPDSLENTGTGDNYGIEFTIEKFFSNKYFFMSTVSLYESFYVGSDNVRRKTNFSGTYTFNFLGTREFAIGDNKAFSIGMKVTAAGNKRYGPIDSALTVQNGEIVYIDSLRNTLQLTDYFRADLKINYKINQAKVTHEIGLDIVNLLNTKNVLKLTFAPDPTDPTANPIREEFQLGLLPIFYYKIDF